MVYIVGRYLLRELLDERRMTQVEFAEKLGVPVQQVNKYVRNERKMSLQTALNVAAILKCRVEDLYELTEVGDNE